MHAGLVNGGGFLLALLSPLLISNSGLLQFLVIMGSISLALGSTWKLLQSNVKKMLACSTISQMGFMILQCGLGFFPSAVAHLCSHGLFKCFLFLNSGSVIQTPPRIAQNRHKISLPVASVCAFVGFICFSQIAGYSNSPHTGWILATFAGIGAMQASYAAIEKAPKFKLITGLLVSIGFSSLYAITYLKIESLVKPITMEEPQPLSIIHLASIFSIFLLFLIINFFPHYIENKTIWKKFYVKMVNWSQSHPTTITATRTDYQF
jgi:NAD(P)H-quinone oxidoreductase subunit 5